MSLNIQYFVRYMDKGKVLKSPLMWTECRIPYDPEGTIRGSVNACCAHQIPNSNLHFVSGVTILASNKTQTLPFP